MVGRWEESGGGVKNEDHQNTLYSILKDLIIFKRKLNNLRVLEIK